MTDIVATDTTDTTTEVEKPAVVAEVQAEQPKGRDFEAEARKGGWRPMEEWTGDPEHWKDAKTWVENGDVHAIVARLEKRHATDFEKLRKQNERTLKSVLAQHEKEISELRAERKVAIKAGNVDEVEKLDKAIDDLREAGPDKEPVEDAQAVQEKWIEAQNWWESDKKMRAYAIGFSQELLAANPKITMEENLRQTEVELRKEYPEKFGGAKRPSANGHALVDGGGAFPGGPQKADPLAKLPAPTRAQAKADMAKFPKMYPTAQSWLDTFESKT